MAKKVTGKQAVSAGRKHEKRWSDKDITVTYTNRMQERVLERALADVYVKKVRAGNLRE